MTNKSRVPALRTRHNSISPHGSKGTADSHPRDESGLALNPGYLADPEVTIIHRIDGRGFNEPRVSEGDLVVADRRTKPEDGSLVIAVLNGERVVRLFHMSGGHQFLRAGDDAGEGVEVTDDAPVQILATVVSRIPLDQGP